MTKEEANKEAIKMMSQASTETLKALEGGLSKQYAKHNGVSNFNDNKKWDVLIAIEEQLTIVRSELKSRK